MGGGTQAAKADKCGRGGQSKRMKSYWLYRGHGVGEARGVGIGLEAMRLIDGFRRSSAVTTETFAVLGGADQVLDEGGAVEKVGNGGGA